MLKSIKNILFIVMFIILLLSLEISVDAKELGKSRTTFTEQESLVLQKIAIAEAGIEGLEDKLVGPTAVIMTSEDYLETTKAIYNFSKENDFYKISNFICYMLSNISSFVN